MKNWFSLIFICLSIQILAQLKVGAERTNLYFPILKNKRMYNKSSYAYEVDKINFVDINTKLDFEIAKALKKFKIRN